MSRKPTPHYPGKPGPTPVGLSRHIPLPLMLDADEYEYLSRLENVYTANAENDRKVKKAHIIRSRVFHPGWKQELEKMRREQGANIP